MADKCRQKWGVAGDPVPVRPPGVGAKPGAPPQNRTAPHGPPSPMLTKPTHRLTIAVLGALLAIASRPQVDVRIALAMLGAFFIGLALGSRSD